MNNGYEVEVEYTFNDDDVQIIEVSDILGKIVDLGVEHPADIHVTLLARHKLKYGNHG